MEIYGTYIYLLYFPHVFRLRDTQPSNAAIVAECTIFRLLFFPVRKSEERLLNRTGCSECPPGFAFHFYCNASFSVTFFARMDETVLSRLETRKYGCAAITRSSAVSVLTETSKKKNNGKARGRTQVTAVLRHCLN